MARDDHPQTRDVSIEAYVGPRSEVAWSFREAEDSEALLTAYLELGQVWVARDAAGAVLGHLQAVPRADVTDSELTWEVTNTAVVEAERGRGIGRRLLERAVVEARRAGVTRLVLATGAADVGNLRFYQRCGFRMTHIVQDAFVPANGYPDALVVDGIPLLDQVWFARRL
jgi:GNAT superfamily N-acetyltransferase